LVVLAFITVASTALAFTVVAFTVVQPYAVGWPLASELLRSVLLLTAHTAHTVLPAAVTIPIQPATTRTGAALTADILETTRMSHQRHRADPLAERLFDLRQF
jgi:hypothetical protein